MSNRLKIKQNKLIEKVVTSSEVVIFFLFTTNFIDLSNNNNMEKTASHCGERSFYAEQLHMSYILSQKPQYIVKTGYYGLDNTIYCGVYYWREGMRFGKGRREAVPLNTGSSQKAGEDR